MIIQLVVSGNALLVIEINDLSHSITENDSRALYAIGLMF